ncbi:MAG: phytochelatin synthase family protein [Deltaproteobacteria bacterium]
MIRRVLFICLAVLVVGASRAWTAPDAAPAPPKYGPAGAPYAAPLWQSHEYFQSAKNPAPDFWTLINHYTGQESSLYCSVASVTIVLNAIARTSGNLRAGDANYQQAKLLDQVRAEHWKERLTGNGWKDRKGLTLAELDDAVRETFKIYGIKGWTVARRSFPDAAPADLGELRAILAANEASADDFIIAHFVQDKLTNDPGGPYPHISPIGAYDAASGRALILDVDREYYGPYWVSVERLLAALAARTPAFGHGGLLIVRRISR